MIKNIMILTGNPMKKILMNRRLPLLILVLMTACGDKLAFPEKLSCNPMRKQVAMGPDDAILDLRKQIAEIEKDEEKKLKSMSKLNDLYSRLGLKYLDKEMWDLAVNAFNTSVKYGRRYPGNFYSLGLAHAYRAKDTKSADDIDKAEGYFRKALEMEKDYKDAKFSLAILLFYEKNKRDEARNLMEELVKGNKFFYPARFGLARFTYEMDQPDRALTLYQDLETDLAKASDSSEIIEYRKQSRENINRLLKELSAERKK